MRTASPLRRVVDELHRHPASALVIGRSVGFAAAFAIPIVLSRILDQSEFGTYKQLFLIYATLFGVAQLGMAESLYYFIPRDSTGAGQHIASALATLAAAGVACLTLLLLFSPGIAGWLKNPQLTPGLLPLGIFLTLTLVAAPLEIVLVSRRKYGSAALTYAVSDLTRVACILSPALVIGTISAVMWGAAGFACARLGAMVWTLRRDLVTSFKPDVSMWREQLAYALPFALAVAVDVIQSNFHQYVVATRYDAATFAIFAVGVLQVPLVDVIATSSANVMMVKMGADGLDSRGVLALWHDTIVRLSLLVFPLVVFMLIAAHDIIVLVYTDAYLASIPIYQLSTLAILPTCLCVDAVLRARAQTRVLFGLNLVRLGAVVVLIGWSLTAFGLSGAVIATLLATVLARALGLARIARLMNVGYAELLPWKRLTITGLVAMIAALPAVWVHAALSVPRLLELLIMAAVYGAAFVLLSFRQGSLTWSATPAGGRLPSPTCERRVPDAL